MRLPDAIRNYRGEAGASLKTYLKTAIRRDVMDAIGHERREPIHGKRSGDDVVVGIEAAVGGWESAVEEDAYAEPLEYEARNVRLSPGLTQTVKTLPAVR
jgi:DNA-directed RNA polymerase specialized sigma subunit